MLFDKNIEFDVSQLVQIILLFMIKKFRFFSLPDHALYFFDIVKIWLNCDLWAKYRVFEAHLRLISHLDRESRT